MHVILLPSGYLGVFIIKTLIDVEDVMIISRWILLITFASKMIWFIKIKNVY